MEDLISPRLTKDLYFPLNGGITAGNMGFKKYGLLKKYSSQYLQSATVNTPGEDRLARLGANREFK